MLTTQDLSDDCEDNSSILVILIVANLMSLMQLIFFMTDRLATSNQEKNEEEFRRIGDMEMYVNKGGNKLEAIIDNRNQDILLKLMNAYVF